ncbi:MAG: NUDIX domain-containing protein [Desulfovibrio sp.]|jgi:8-oxo-dGTP pyrophosphatase MutT (NUDIX family)|nr:NUDIX domain-containing protein [Desulfovibrio sp.]
MGKQFFQKKKAGGEKEEVGSRIGQVGNRIRAAGTYILSAESFTQNKRAEACRDLQETLGRELGAEDTALLCEVTDNAGRLLMCMPADAARHKALRLKVCVLALRSGNARLILRRRVRGGSDRRGLWGLYCGHVLVGEAGEDAALRLLASEGGLLGLKVEKIADSASGAPGAQFSLFRADLPPGLYPAHSPDRVLEVDRDELDGLVKNTPELLTPELIWAAGAGLLIS